MATLAHEPKTYSTFNQAYSAGPDVNWLNAQHRDYVAVCTDQSALIRKQQTYC